MVASRRNQNQTEMNDRFTSGTNYARWDNPAIMKGLTLMRQIRTWLLSCYAPEHCPHPHMSIAEFGMCILVNDHCVWDSENDSEDDLTVDYCKAKLKEHALNLMTPFDDQ